MDGIEIISGDLELLARSTSDIGDRMLQISCDSISSDVTTGMPGSASLTIASSAVSTITAVAENLAKQIFEFSEKVSRAITNIHEGDMAVGQRFDSVSADLQSPLSNGAAAAPSARFGLLAQRLGN